MQIISTDPTSSILYKANFVEYPGGLYGKLCGNAHWVVSVTLFFFFLRCGAVYYFHKLFLEI